MNATQIRNLFQNRAIRFALVQLAHTTITVIVLAALVLGAARVGALNGLMASAAPSAGTSFTAVNYQGRLADSSGNPINNTNPGVGMTFALYSSDTGGSPVWSETHANVPVSNGLFSVKLGSVNALSTDYLTGDRWLGIQVGIDPEMTPREKLAAVPYAMQAGLALMVPDGSITTTQIADGAATSRKVNLDSGMVVGDPISGISLTPSRQDVPGASTTIVADSNLTIIAVGVFDFGTDASTAAVGELWVDGVSVGDRSAIQVGGRQTVAQTYRFQITPGSHTLKLRAYTAYGSSGIINPKHTSLIWFALSQ